MDDKEENAIPKECCECGVSIGPIGHAIYDTVTQEMKPYCKSCFSKIPPEEDTATKHLITELQSVLKRFGFEYDIPVASVIGCLEVVKQEQLNNILFENEEGDTNGS